MKFSVDPKELTKALRLLARKQPGTPRRDVDVQITATTDGVVFQSNQTTAFVTAQVAVAGACVVSREILAKLLATYPKDQPITLEVSEGKLRMGRMRIPVRNQFLSRENTKYKD